MSIFLLYIHDFWTQTVEICFAWSQYHDKYAHSGCLGYWWLCTLYFQQMNKIKAENTKLKEENRALTRVISKLSR